MRCHFSDRDESILDPSALNIWTSNLQNPSILESVENINGIEEKSFSDITLYTLDSVSQSSKRKILECEKEDFEERYSKIQRKRQILYATSKENLNEDDGDDVDDDNLEDSDVYEEMEWVQDESSTMSLHFLKEKGVDLSFQSINASAPIMYLQKLNWREERRHLLRISMAKIRGVDDPENYLRRSVLINNTVKRLQKDVTVNHLGPFLPPSPNESSTSHISNHWNLGSPSETTDSCKRNYGEEHNIQYCRPLSSSDSSSSYIFPNVETITPYNFQLSVITPFPQDKTIDSLQTETLHTSVFSKTLLDEQSICDPFLCRTLKPVNTVHMYSSQPCGLQYRNSSHEDNEYPESTSSSSLLDSVVYHSLIASLET